MSRKEFIIEFLKAGYPWFKTLFPAFLLGHVSGWVRKQPSFMVKNEVSNHSKSDP
jgi:hypothetical protein